MKNYVYYRCVINQITTAAPGDGFIDPKRANDYMTYDPSTGTSGWPSSTANALSKARANWRWEFVIEQLGIVANPIDVFAIVINGADINTAPTSIEFTVVYERPDYIQLPDSQNAGTILEGTDAVTRMIVNAMMIDRTQTVTLLNPVTDTDPVVAQFQTLNEEIGPLGTDIASLTALVTVTEISNTNNSEGNYPSNA